MRSRNASRNVQEQRHKTWDWVLELALFAMVVPAMIYDFLSLGTFAGL